MNAYLKGILRGLEIAYKLLEKADPENNDELIVGSKMMILRSIQHWQQISLIRDCNNSELNMFSPEDSMDTIALKLKEMGKEFNQDDKTQYELEEELLTENSNTHLIS